MPNENNFRRLVIAKNHKTLNTNLNRNSFMKEKVK